MTFVYIVTAGAWSDYGIHACFSTRELAQAYIDSRPKDLESYHRDAKEYEEPVVIYIEKHTINQKERS